MKVTQETLKEIVPKYNIKAIKQRLRIMQKYKYYITDPDYLKAVKMCKKNELFDIDKKNHSNGYLILWFIYFSTTGIISMINTFDMALSLCFGGSTAVGIILYIIWKIQRWRFDPLPISDKEIIDRYKYCRSVPTMIEDFDEDDIAEVWHDLDRYDYAFCRSEYPDESQHYLPILYAVYLNDTQGANIDVPFKVGYDVDILLRHYLAKDTDWFGWGDLNECVQKCCPKFDNWVHELANELDH